MNFTAQHKALGITFLITGCVVLALFSFQLGKHTALMSETFYEIEPELEKDILEAFEDSKDELKNASNNAYNEDEEFEKLMKNFKALTSKSSKPEPTITAQAKETNTQNSTSLETTNALKAEESQAYKDLQDKLKKRLNNKKQADAHSKTKSTLTYSLKGRTLTYYETPRYLCEFGGKIVVNISVNETGDVVDISINNSSTSRNQCLIDAAINYAESAQFNTSELTNQIGTITFLFKGKN